MSRLELIATILGAGLMLAGCAGAGGSGPAASPAATTTATQTLTDQEMRFLADLNAIDPDMVTNTERALRRASNVCLDITQGKDEATVVENARQRYSNGTTVNLSPDEAQRIVDAASETVC